MRLGAIIAVLLAASIGSSVQAADAVITVDMNRIGGAVQAIGETVQVEGQKEPLKLSEVSEVVFAPSLDVMAQPNVCVIVTAGGSRIAATDVTIADDKVSFTSPLWGNGPTSISITETSMIYMPESGGSAADVVQAIGSVRMSDKAVDVVVRKLKGGDYLAAPGVVSAVTAQSVTFTRNDKPVTYPRTSVVAIRFATVTSQPAPAGGVLVGAKDGTLIRFTKLTLSGDDITAQTKDLGTLKLPRAAVANIRFLNEAVVDLSSLKPQAKEHGLFDKVFGYKLNKAVDGSPMKLKGEAYASGVGVHSHCELTYSLDGQYKRFVMLAGIDDAVAPAGNAHLTVLGDGKPLTVLGGKETFNGADLTGKTDPVPVRLDVANVKKLTIIVGFGSDKLDVADHVNLAAAKLIK